MRLQDCYTLLEIDPRASAEEIRSAHRDLTKVWHPDRFGNDIALRKKAEEKLKAINEAYETLRAAGPQRFEQIEDNPARLMMIRNRTYAIVLAVIAVLVLLRRPSPAGVVIALLLFVAAFVFVSKMRGSASG